MPAIKLENINVTFKAKEKEVEAVKNVSLEIEKGDIYGIIGYSGAGKALWSGSSISCSVRLQARFSSMIRTWFL